MFPFLPGPARKDELARRGEPLLKSIRQLIESVNDTLKGQLDLEAHGGRAFEGVTIRVARRILATSAKPGWTSPPMLACGSAGWAVWRAPTGWPYSPCGSALAAVAKPGMGRAT